jgi:uncharacterized iron-regulated membrane protein
VYRAHVWFGLVVATGVITISVTGIYLNHAGSLGFWRPPEHQSQGSIDNALPIRQLVIHGLTAGHNAGLDVATPRDVASVTYSPGSNQAAVRFTDRGSAEAVLDATTGRPLKVAQRNDATLERLHTGEVLGQRGVIVSDVIAVVLVALTLGGVWLWLTRLLRREKLPGTPAPPGRWMQINRRLHLAGGLGAAVFVIMLSVTGVLLNHKRELGYMEEPFQSVEYAPHERGEPMALSQIAALGIKNAGNPELDAVADIELIEFPLPTGYAKVRFKDADSTEVIVNVYNGRIVNVAQRRDFFLEALHRGDALGGRAGRWLIDVCGLMLILLTLNGLYVWIWPVWSDRSRAARDEGQVDLAEV